MKKPFSALAAEELMASVSQSPAYNFRSTWPVTRMASEQPKISSKDTAEAFGETTNFLSLLESIKPQEVGHIGECQEKV
jgi:hypothetical protein